MQTKAMTYFEPKKYHTYIHTNKDSLGPSFLIYEFRVRIAPSQRADCQHRLSPHYTAKNCPNYIYVCVRRYLYTCVYRRAYTRYESIGRGSSP